VAKLIVGLGALSLCGFLSASSVGGEGRVEPATSSDQTSARAMEAGDLQTGATELMTSGSTERRPAAPGEMSQEEKERRKQVCENEYEACYDQCTRFYANKRGWSKLQPCQRECGTKLGDCMGKIPS